MWDGRDVGVRLQASVLSQIKCIEAGGLLSEYEKSEIEQRVECESKDGVSEPNPAGQEEENVDFRVHIEESDEFECDNEFKFGMESESGNELEFEGREMCIEVDCEEIDIRKELFVEVERFDCVVKDGGQGYCQKKRKQFYPESDRYLITLEVRTFHPLKDVTGGR